MVAALAVCVVPAGAGAGGPPTISFGDLVVGPLPSELTAGMHGPWVLAQVSDTVVAAPDCENGRLATWDGEGFVERGAFAPMPPRPHVFAYDSDGSRLATRAAPGSASSRVIMPHAAGAKLRRVEGGRAMAMQRRPALSAGVRFCLVCAALLQHPNAAVAGGRLEPITLPNTYSFAAGLSGEFAIVDRETGVLSLFDRKGAKVANCQLPESMTASIASGAAAALRGESLLVAGFAPSPGAEGGTQVGVYSLRECKQEVRFSAPGPVLAASPHTDGYVLTFLANRSAEAVGKPGAGPPLAFQLIDTRGEKLADLGVPADLEERLAGLGAEGIARASALLVQGRKLWFLPHAAYELWPVGREGAAPQPIVPPACLAAEGRELSSEESTRRMQQLFDPAKLAENPELQAIASRLSGPDAPRRRVYQRAVAAVATYRNLVGLAVRDPLREDGGCRLDIWDTTTDQLVGLVQIAGECPASMALSDEAAVVARKGLAERLDLPEALIPIEDPCAREVESLLDLKRSRTPPPDATTPQ
ncbi:MAG: hypothetical protein KA072_00550 [Thermoanaerobaculaceae bacterium]|nr:hypothetical protein [Thermoanaerobaculaceae bacterium]MDI9621258.1 hypothetical protein [Acidobacteriota bacterium]NLH11921.1 hypothetical protein [Holophagae bacterium]HPW54210.1 hypothetical protein [Thermoanaerobaculaceae bacterium]